MTANIPAAQKYNQYVSVSLWSYQLHVCWGLFKVLSSTFHKNKNRKKKPKNEPKKFKGTAKCSWHFFCECFEYPHNNAAKTHSGKMPLIIIYSFSYWTFVLDYYRNSSFEHSCISVYVHVYLPATDNCRSSTFSSSKWSGHPLV